MLTRIYIRNFRSIREMTIDCENINTFIGKNDAGKSNVMKALNLFFNGETDHQIAYNFDSDFSHFSGSKKKREIVVELTFRIPHNYNTNKKKNRDVKWGKSWQRAYNADDKKEWMMHEDGEEFPQGSKISYLLRTTNFHYVPAIKDKDYFSHLMSQLYNVLEKFSRDKILQSTNGFQKSIRDETKKLRENIENIFNLPSEISLPQDFRQIFENLEFHLGGIPINRRGDGVKMRHIPEILNFIGVFGKEHSKQQNIWVLEEPENCMEIEATFKMQKKFVDYANQGYQIFITTHSPVFYRIESKKRKCKNYFVYKSEAEKDEYSEIQEIPEAFEIDKRMENVFLPPEEIAKVYLDIKKLGKENEKEKLEKEKLEKELQKFKNNIIFVEGKSDAKIIDHALNLLCPEEANRINILPKENYSAGADKMATIVQSWVSMTDDEKIKAFVIFDDDEKGNSTLKSLSSALHKKIKVAGTLKLAVLKSKKIGEIRKKFPKIVTDLEAMYSDKIWEYAKKQNWIEQKKQQETMSQLSNFEQKRLTDIFPTQPALFNDLPSVKELSNADKLRIFCEWKKNTHKQDIADYIIGLPSNEAKEALEEFKPIIDEIIAYFNS